MSAKEKQAALKATFVFLASIAEALDRGKPQVFRGAGEMYDESNSERRKRA